MYLSLYYELSSVYSLFIEVKHTLVEKGRSGGTLCKDIYSMLPAIGRMHRSFIIISLVTFIFNFYFICSNLFPDGDTFRGTEWVIFKFRSKTILNVVP